uniref:Eukaryotic translation initiation factor 4eb n=1 Tax=Mola mola TaxID=94237 RepID=A0A3Q3VS54_MOLML
MTPVHRWKIKMKSWRVKGIYSVVCFAFVCIQDGIKPMWEDERNRRGGRWLITLSKQQRKSDLDQFWLETLLCLVGEAFENYSDDVCGAVINVRAKGDKIAIWTTNYENKEAITHIGRSAVRKMYHSHGSVQNIVEVTALNIFVLNFSRVATSLLRVVYFYV